MASPPAIGNDESDIDRRFHLRTVTRERSMWHLARCCLVLLGPFALFAAEPIEWSGTQASGSHYRITRPCGAGYNDRLVVWVHGFQDATDPVGIPEDQLQLGDLYLPDLVNSLGFGFATNSFSKTGLAVQQGIDDIRDLVRIYLEKVGKPRKVYLVGVSEGGLITTLLLERFPDEFSGGIAACGPIGDFQSQVNFIGDARVTFDYYFPDLIPGNPFQPPEELIENWKGPEGYYETVVAPVLHAPQNAARRDEWSRVAKMQFDPTEREATLRIAIEQVLRYAVVNFNDTTATLGGIPYENRWTWYAGAQDPLALNRGVHRQGAAPAAIRAIRQYYTTTGRLRKPLMTMHTLRDPLVPYWHEPWYTVKNWPSQSFLSQRLNLPVDRFGHCNFTTEEALLMFTLLLKYNGDLSALLREQGNRVSSDPFGNLTLQGRGRATSLAWPK
jgi:pimeloyl-ACP methyl ester carboxylesterase